MVSLGPILDYIVNGLKTVINWLISMSSDYLPFSAGASYLPDNFFDFRAVVDSSSYAYLLLWFPADYAISCFVAYCALACTVYLVNWILGMIPSVS